MNSQDISATFSRLVSLLSDKPHRPQFLSIEPTSRCNLNCPFCLVGLQNTLPSTEHNLLPRGLGDMEWSLYKKLVKDAVAFGIKKIQLHFQGEPLMYRKFPDMVREAKKYDLWVQAFTNGLPLTKRKADEIILAGLDSLRFSVDGASQDIYQLNRVGGDFDRVYANMASMVAQARKHRSNIKLMWQFIALRNNEHEIEEAKKKAHAIGIPFFVKTFAETDPELKTQNPKLQRKLKPKPCTDIHEAIFVYYNGDVVACCYDLDEQNVVGNLYNQTLTEVWNSPEYRSLRKRIDEAATNPADEPQMCKDCLKWGNN